LESILDRYKQSVNKILVEDENGEWVKYQDVVDSLRYIIRALEIPEHDVEYFVEDAINQHNMIGVVEE